MNKFLSESLTPYSLDELGGGLPIEKQTFQSGETRNYQQIFADLKDVFIEKIIVRDPYSGSNHGQDSLLKLLLIIRSLANTISKINIHCRELHKNDDFYKSPILLEREVGNLLRKNFDNVLCNVKVHGFYESKKNFHDRSLEITVTDETGQTVEHVYDLLGGIEKLMDSNHKTTIFHYQTNG